MTTSNAWGLRIKAKDGSGERIMRRFEHLAGFKLCFFNGRYATFETRKEAREVAKKIRQGGLHVTPIKLEITAREVF